MGKKKLIRAGELTEGANVRTVFHQMLNSYISENGISDEKPFRGGSKPDLADIEVYGVLQSIKGHIVYDEMLRKTNIAAWMSRMECQTTGKKSASIAGNYLQANIVQCEGVAM